MTTRFTVRNDVDFIPLASVMIGFQPEHSLVMMTLGSFTARIDIPDEAKMQEFISALLEPAIRHQIKGVVFVIFDQDDNFNLKVELYKKFSTAGIEVKALLQYADGKYRSYASPNWYTLDIASHPITLEAAYQDIGARHTSREALADYIKPRGEMWEIATAEAVAGMRVNGLEETVRVLSREGASESVELWTAALRGCDPDSELASDCAVVLGFAAWLKGDGALAWVAHDHIKPSEFSDLLGYILEKAISPETWPCN